jgi:gluconokinase
VEPAHHVVIIVVMGVAGAGKTTVGRSLAAALAYEFKDADDFHPAANVEKMRRGHQLDDADREPWLEAMAQAIDGWLRDGAGVVLACSALKQRYRERLLRDPSRMRVVYLRVSPELARQRAHVRVGHFMPSGLVDSQFAALEEPTDAIVIDGGEEVAAIVAAIRAQLMR